MKIKALQDIFKRGLNRGLKPALFPFFIKKYVKKQLSLNFSDIVEKAKKQFLEISQIPVLYKYLDWEGGLKMLQNSTIKFSNPHSLNDPYDCSVELLDYSFETYKILKKLNSKISKGEELNFFQKHIKLFAENYDGSLDMKVLKDLYEQFTFFRVTSFTDSPLNELMWAHYANNGEGICIGINPFLMMTHFLEKNIGLDGYKMKYVDELSKKNFFDFYCSNYDSIILTHQAIYKTRKWEHENEIRFIIVDDSIVFPCFQEIPSYIFTDVYIGINVSKENEKEMMRYAQFLNPKINLHKIFLDSEKLKISAYDI